MAYYLRKKKKQIEECDCTAPVDSMSTGMGLVIPGFSGDRFDYILGGYIHPKRKRKLRKRK